MQSARRGSDGPKGPILVTGATGFIGSRLVRRLLDEGHDVHGISRAPHHDQGGRLTWWRADLARSTAVTRLVRQIRPATVVHLAGHVHGGPNIEFVHPTLESNLLGTVNLLTAALASGCDRVLVTGTMVEPDDRAAAGIAGSPYAMSKWAASSYARMYHALYALPLVILRVFMVYGPGQPARKLIAHTALSALRGERPQVSSGRWELDWIYVDDVVDAYWAALAAQGLEGETLDVGSGELVSMRAVVEQIAELAGTGVRPEFGAEADRPAERPRAADVDRSSRMLAWRPATSLDEGLRHTVDWYREHGDSL